MELTASSWKPILWRVAKVCLALAILAFIGRQFYRDLQKEELHELHWRPAWIGLSCGLYLLALAGSAWFWVRLLRAFGDRPSLFAAFRAYYIGHLGKYVPGKAWALLMRGGLVTDSRTRLGVAIITAFYEVLTTMAAGALIAAVVYVFDPPTIREFDWHPAFTGLMLLGLCGLPLVPAVFNFLTRRMARRFRRVADFNLPPVRIATLFEGLVLTSLGWALMGLSVWSILQSALPDPPPLTLNVWARCCAAIALSYVAGFLAFVLPSGVGVREYFLRSLLWFAGPLTLITAAVLLLRLFWTATELLVAAILLPFVRKSGD